MEKSLIRNFLEHKHAFIMREELEDHIISLAEGLIEKIHKEIFGSSVLTYAYDWDADHTMLTIHVRHHYGKDDGYDPWDVKVNVQEICERAGNNQDTIRILETDLTPEC